MAGDVVDITQALEQRRFKVKEERLQKMREAFEAARLDANPKLKAKPSRPAKNKRNKKAKKPSR